MLDKKTRIALKTLDSRDTLLKLLSAADLADMNQRDVDSISRAHRKLPGQVDCKVAYLGNHTMEPLDRFVDVSCLLQGLSVQTYLGEYDQFFQEILDLESGCHAFAPDIIFLDLSLRSLAPTIYDELISLTFEQRQDELNRILSVLSDWVELAKQQTNAALVVSNFTRPARLQLGVADTQLSMGEAEFYRTLNLKLAKLSVSDARVNILDMDHVLSCIGKFQYQDPKMYYLAKMEWSEHSLPVIADELLRMIIAITGKARKCLVLDLDNTLWGGIVGEDGVDDLKIGEGSPEGEAFSDFQRHIRVLKNRGILLAICSKNNIEDAKAAFLNREEMLLKLEDFSSIKINWEHKHLNIQNIARDLNIGTDSLVFVDDNPAECSLVRQMLPEVETVELSRDPSTYVAQLKNLPVFEKLVITDEDRQKTEQYTQNARRTEQKREINDINTFLESLGTEIKIGSPENKHKARIHQLFSKTNQFNVTTHRYSLADIQRFIEKEEWDINITHVKDNFGELGIVGLYLINKQDKHAAIDSFILSCRAMGRGIETAMMNKIKEDYLLNGSFEQIHAIYSPTAKNIPAKKFYETEGFDVVSTDSSGKKNYIVNKQCMQLHECARIKIGSI